MKNKKILIFIIQILLIICFTISITPKTFQNDTFFSIALGENIVKNGIEKEETLVWHKGLEYTNSRWLFDVVIYLLNNQFGFKGIYIFVILIAILQALMYYYILNKIMKKSFFSFILTLLIMNISRVAIAARAQVISFLLFLIQFYCIEQLLETQRKRYFVILSIIPLILANVHASVFPMYFVLYLPYIAEYILANLKLKKSEESKILIQNKNVILLFVLIIIGVIMGFCTPDSVEPYTDLFKAMSGISNSFIIELQPININNGIILFFFIFINVAIISFTKTKVRITDCFFILGFALLALTTNRSIFFFYIISSICTFRIINDCLEIYKINFYFIKKKYKLLSMTLLYSIVLVISINRFINVLKTEYINYVEYPVSATNYILNNVNISDMKIFNHFNFGSYLEFRGIPAFIDSRSGIYTPEFNPGVTILEDWLNVIDRFGTLSRHI